MIKIIESHKPSNLQAGIFFCISIEVRSLYFNQIIAYPKWDMGATYIYIYVFLREGVILH